MTGRVNAMLRLRSNDDGRIAITVTSIEENERLALDDTSVVLTLWAESADVIRGRFVDQQSGAVAYFQSSDSSFQEFARAIHIVGPRPI
jgi:hypothetical protein